MPNKGRPVWNNQPVGTMENEQIAEKLNNPKEYAKIWGKKDRNDNINRLERELTETKQQLEKVSEGNKNKIFPLWLIPAMFIASGIAVLIFWILRRKKAY